MNTLTITLKAPDSNETSHELDTEKILLAQRAVILACNGLKRGLRRHLSHVEIGLNLHQDEMSITFKFRGEENQAQEKPVPWIVLAATRILFNFTPDIRAEAVVTRIHEAIKSAVAERTEKLRASLSDQLRLINDE